jgi:hypothetical protein
MKNNAFLGAILIALSLVCGAVLSTVSCTPAERQDAARMGLIVLNLDTTKCIEKALVAGRTDLIQACKGEGIHDALDLLDQALAEQVCNLPDASVPQDAGGQ